MRSWIVLSIVFLLCDCASTSPALKDTELVTRIGVIASKEVVDLEDSRNESRVNTSVSASVSSGGGLALGLGFLMSSLFIDTAENPPLRYRVDLLEDEQICVFHHSDLFEVGDCVEISTLADDDSTPPMMKRSKDAC
jgi:hypothetical protein